MPHDVLISYSHEDKLQADAICNRLESQGIRCWIAPRDVPLGAEYADSIVQAIESSEAVVLVYSTNADQSPHVRREVERAVSLEITLVPVRIENNEMSEAFQYYVGSRHWLDAITPPLEAHIDRLIEHLKKILPAGEPTPDPVPKTDPKPKTGSELGLGSELGSVPEPDSVPEPTPISPPPREPAPLPVSPASTPALSGGTSRRTVVTVAGVAVIGIAAMVGYRIQDFLEPAGPGLVPDVAGRSQAEATAALEEGGLDVQVEEMEDARLNYPAAIRTEPSAGQPADRGSRVTLYVSGMVVLPDLQGSMIDDATNQLELADIASGLVKRVDEPNPSPTGTVFRQDPAPGIRVLRNNPVTLYVAGEKVSVPDVVGSTQAEAAQRIEDTDLAVRAVRDWNPDANVGAVFRTLPESGAELSQGDTVTLFVSALGGWAYAAGRRFEEGSTVRWPLASNLRNAPETTAGLVGGVDQGASVRILQVGAYDWYKIVVER